MEESLLVLLGIAGSMIVGLIAFAGVLLKRNGSSNPNLSTIDEKLNDILICLTRIETTVGNCPVIKTKQ